MMVTTPYELKTVERPTWRSSRRLPAYAGLLTVVLIAALLLGWALLNRDIARGDELQTQLNTFLANKKLPGRINVFWYVRRVFVDAPVTDDQLPGLMKIIDVAGWVADVDLRNTGITQAGSEGLLQSRPAGRRILTPWNAEVTPFLHD